MERWKLTDIWPLVFLALLITIGVYDSFVHYRRPYGLEHDAALKAPRNFRAQLNASKFFIEQRRWALALAYAQRAIVLHPERASGWINASSAAGGLQAWQLCYTYLKSAFKIFPARQLAINLVFVCRSLGRLEEAEKWEALLPQLKDDMKLEEPTQ